MAGSLFHLTQPTSGWSLIENMGDAYECVEELLWVLERTVGEKEAQRLIAEELYPMQRGDTEKDKALERVNEIMSR